MNSSVAEVEMSIVLAKGRAMELPISEKLGHNRSSVSVAYLGGVL